MAGAVDASSAEIFPWQAVFILALCLTVNGYTLANLYPYVGMMVKHLLGLATTNEAGFYAGYVASAFTLGRFVSSYVWGIAADKIGRKPVLIVGLSAIAVCSVAFGLSTTFTMAILSRFVLGLFNGIMPAVRTIAREICGQRHIAVGMTYIAGSKGIGIVLGTGIGGLLAEPATVYPTVFSSTGLLAKHPFLLPNLVGTCFAIMAIPLVVLGLPETRGKHVDSDEGSRSTTRVGEVAANPRDSYAGESSSVDRRRIGWWKRAYQRLDEDPHNEGEEKRPSRSERGRATVSAEEENLRPGEHSQQVGVELVSRDSSSKGKRVDRRGNHADAAAAKDDNDEEQNDDLHADGDRTAPQWSRGDEAGDGVGLLGRGGLLSLPKVKLVLLIAALSQFMAIGWEEVYPLWALSTTDVGGLGWSISRIGKVLAVTGVVMAVLQLGGFPTLVKKLGMVTWQRVGWALGMFTFLAAPHAKWFSWSESSLIVVVVLTNICFSTSMAGISLAMAIASTSVVPAHQRGQFGGLFMMAESVGRCTGPASYANLFAWSVSRSAPLGVNFRFVFVMAACIMGTVAAMGWRTLDEEFLLKPAEKPAGVGGGQEPASHRREEDRFLGESFVADTDGTSKSMPETV